MMSESAVDNDEDIYIRMLYQHKENLKGHRRGEVMVFASGAGRTGGKDNEDEDEPDQRYGTGELGMRFREFVTCLAGNTTGARLISEQMKEFKEVCTSSS